MNRRRTLAIGLLTLGLLHMTGETLSYFGLKRAGSAVSGFAAATGASPAPKVFSAVRGLETYSTRFYLEWTDRDGASQSVELTPEIYSRLRGPYNRRNVYGAALAYGPVLATNPATRTMYEAVIHRALCGQAPLLDELGIDTKDRTGPVRVRYSPAPGSRMDGLPSVLEPSCP